MIPLSQPFIEERELRAVIRTLKSGWLTQGPQVKRFEENFARRIGVPHAIAMNSATSVLQLAMEALQLDGEVILPSLTFMASANAILNAGCRPVFVDIDYETNNIDPEAIESAIGPRTCALMPVHFGGLSCDMQRIAKIAGRHNLTLIEDAAEAIGATCHGKIAGSHGLGCFSFFPTKNLTTGEGGMATTSDRRVAERMRGLRAHGVTDKARRRLASSSKPWRRVAETAGYNFRMSDILAALGVEQLRKLNRMNQLRREHAAFLNERLARLDLRTPVPPAGYTHVYQMYTIKIDTRRTDRDKLIQSLRKQGVGASVHFDPPVHRHPFYRRIVGKQSLPNSERAARALVTLPMYPQLKKAQLSKIVRSVQSALREARR